MPAQDVAHPQRGAPIQILAFLGLALPMAANAVWVQSLQAGGMTLRIMFLGPLLGGVGLMLWILVLHRFLCRDSFDFFGFRRENFGLDIALGIGLAALTLAFHYMIGPMIGRLFAPRPPPLQIIELIEGVARDPWLLALWLGPTVWIGVALFEEIARAFLLRRLWLVWPGDTGRWGVILIVSALIGLAHGYQGPAAVLSIGLNSILLCWVFAKTGRIRALIIHHALYDSVQIVHAVVMIRGQGSG